MGVPKGCDLAECCQTRAEGVPNRTTFVVCCAPTLKRANPMIWSKMALGEGGGDGDKQHAGQSAQRLLSAALVFG